MKEKWKEIEGYSGRYLISNLGRVKSVDFIVSPFGIHDSCLLKGRIFKPRLGKPVDKQYLGVVLGGVSKKVHRLVAEHFIPNPNNRRCVNHIDGNKLNNRVDNLEWVTHGENQKHAYKLGLRKKPIGYNDILPKPVIDTVTGVTYISAKEAAIKHGIPYSTLKCRLNGSLVNSTSLVYLENI